MDRLALEERGPRLLFVERLNEVIGHRDRIGPFCSYCAGACRLRAQERRGAGRDHGSVAGFRRSINRFCNSWARRAGPMKLF
jgi:hypothetical protein